MGPSRMLTAAGVAPMSSIIAGSTVVTAKGLKVGSATDGAVALESAGCSGFEESVKSGGGSDAVSGASRASS